MAVVIEDMDKMGVVEMLRKRLGGIQESIADLQQDIVLMEIREDEVRMALLKIEGEAP